MYNPFKKLVLTTLVNKILFTLTCYFQSIILVFQHRRAQYEYFKYNVDRSLSLTTAFSTKIKSVTISLCCLFSLARLRLAGSYIYRAFVLKPSKSVKNFKDRKCVNVRGHVMRTDDLFDHLVTGPHPTPGGWGSTYHSVP